MSWELFALTTREIYPERRYFCDIISTTTHPLLGMLTSRFWQRDLLQREGHYPVPPQAGPILGVEFSGTIETLGEGCKDGFKKGDEVFGLAYGGAYAEYIAVNTHMLLHKPEHLSWVEAAGIPEVSNLTLKRSEVC